jgi:hypothetical protein
MKKTIIFFLLYTGVHLWGQVGIGVSNPTKGAMLEVSSTSKGFLPPRLTTAQRDGIKPVPEALLIYNTDRKCLQYWNTAKWVNKGCPPLPVPNPDTSKNCTGWQLPYTNNGGSATGNINGIPVTANFNKYVNNITQIYDVTDCNININNGFWLGKDYIYTSMTIKFNKPVANMKVFQAIVNSGEKMWYVLKNKGVVVKPIIQIVTPPCGNGQFNINQAENAVTCVPKKSADPVSTTGIYTIGNVWFDEVEIYHNGVGNGSLINFCIGNASTE